MKSNVLTERESQFIYLHEEMGMSYAQIASKENIARKTVRNTIYKARKKLEFAESPGVKHISDDMGLSLADLAHGWIKNDDGSFFFKRDKLKDLTPDQLQDIIEDAFKTRVTRVEVPDYPEVNTNDDLLSKYVLTDVHLGMFAWATESGEDYDLDIAEKTIVDSAKTLIDSTPSSSKALVLNLGDYFHANDSKGMTPLSGHILDMDTRFPKIATVGIRIIRYILEYAAEKHDEVEYVSIPGNHDLDQIQWLTLALMEAYRDHPKINIIWNPGPWYCTTHGMNMIAAHHGDRITQNRLVMAMAEMFSKEWGNSYWRFLDTGHVHHQKEEELGGVIVRAYRTLAAKDNFANKGGYVSKRSMTAHTYHKSKGEVLTNNVHLFNGAVSK